MLIRGNDGATCPQPTAMTRELNVRDDHRHFRLLPAQGQLSSLQASTHLHTRPSDTLPASRLGLDGFERHPSLPQPGETGVPKLVTGQCRCRCFLKTFTNTGRWVKVKTNGYSGACCWCRFAGASRPSPPNSATSSHLFRAILFPGEGRRFRADPEKTTQIEVGLAPTTTSGLSERIEAALGRLVRPGAAVGAARRSRAASA